MNDQQKLSVKQIAGEYLRSFQTLLHQTDLEALGRIAGLLAIARDNGATIFVAGNGGSAATASHWVNDLCKATKCAGQPAFRAMSLSDNISWVTALANDEGYDRVFSGQLENFAKPGDVLVVISASGNSQNLVRAVELGRARGITTIAILGFDGGILKGQVDECLLVPTRKGAYGLVESAHSLLCHLLTDCLAESKAQSAERKVQSA